MADRYVAKSVTDLGTVTIADTDSLFFMEGSQQITAGGNLSALTEGLSSIVGGESFFGHVFGGSYGALRCDVDADAPEEVIWDAPGSITLYPGGDESLVKKITQSAGLVNVQTGGTVTNWEMMGGTGYATGDVIVTNVRMQGGNYRQGYHATGNTDVWLSSGATFRSERGFSGVAYVAQGAEAIWRREDASATVPTGGTSYISGHVEWFGGNVGTIYLMHPKASIDMSGVFADATVTVYGYAEAIRNSRFEAKNRAVTITPTFSGVFCGDPDSITPGIAP